MELRDKIPGKNPFRIPENYFEEVNRKILANTSEKQAARISFYSRIKPFLTAAAAIAILVTVAYFSIKLYSPAERERGHSSLSINDNADLLTNELDIATLENDTILTGIFTGIPDLTGSEIIDNLLGEDIDISEIYEYYKY